MCYIFWLPDLSFVFHTSTRLYLHITCPATSALLAHIQKTQRNLERALSSPNGYQNIHFDLFLSYIVNPENTVSKIGIPTLTDLLDERIRPHRLTGSTTESGQSLMDF